MTASTPLLQHVSSVLTRLRVESRGVVVAVSGGLDSVALLHALAMCRAQYNLALHVVHVHHGLRGSAADRDEAFVQSLATTLNLPYSCVRVDVLAEQARRANATVEMVARELRYKALEHTASAVGASVIALAHTANDVAETFLMHLARGSGVAGLGSLPETRQHGAFQLLRPFHAIERSEIEAEARLQGWQWHNDDTNTDTRYLRNNVRHTVMPALREVFGERIITAIHHSAGILRDTDALLEHALAPWMDDLLLVINDGVVLRTSVLETIHPTLVPEVVRRSTRGLAPYPLSRIDLDRILSLMRADVGTQATLRQGLVAVKDREGIVIRKIS